MTRPSDTFPVFGALPALGFTSGGWGLKFRHRQCELGAVQGRMLHPVVAFAGHYNHDGRVFGEIEFKLPSLVESLDQLKALLSYFLRDAITEEVPQWLTEGRALSPLLPWNRETKAYTARDRCTVRREWLRLALKDLAGALKEGVPADGVSFSFDGSLLCIECGRRIVVQAAGKAWQQSYRVPGAQLAELPWRFMHDPVEVSIWVKHLRIGSYGYSLVPE